MEKNKDNALVQESPAPSLLIDSEAASSLLSISQRNLTRLAKQGKIPGAVKVGMLWRFNRRKLEAFAGIEG